MTLSKSPSNSQPQTSQAASQRTLQAFALEPILTPSGIVDAPDGINDVDEIELPSYVNDEADIDIVDDADLDIETQDESTYSSEVNDNEFEVIPFADVDIELSPFESGVFTVGESGEVGIDFLFDSGAYQGEVAIFSLEGMEEFEPGSPDFIYEAASRAVSNSELGHVVISDVSEGARFSGSLGEENFNSGDYQGVKTFAMKPGDEFGIMLVPDGTVEQLVENPTLEGSYRPLFSMSTANPDDAFQAGQIVDVTGDGNTFVFEDMRVDGGSDRDYNDVVFQVRGASGEAALMDDLVAEGHDWRDSDLGKALVEYTKPYVEATDISPDVDYPASPSENQPLIGVIDTGFAANNPDLDYEKITLGGDRLDGDDNPLLAEGEGNEHGTHVLGIIAAQQDNGIGIDGINDDAPVWIGKGVGAGTWAESLVEFVDAARDSNQPNAVVNLSMDLTQIDADGNLSTRYEFTPLEMAALEYARQNNIVVSVAAGNDGGVMSALGQSSQQFDNIITVGSAEQFDAESSTAKGFLRSDYSSYGYGLDIVAEGGTPEQPILSTVGTGTDSMYGTSVATAKVTGGISQVWAANPGLSYRQVIDILTSTATDLATPNVDIETGAGLINIAAAIHLARVTDPEEYTPELQVVPTTWSGEGIVTPLERAARYPYYLQAGDTLWDIAQESLGDATRWPEITRDEAGNVPFTEAEATTLSIDLTVYIPGDDPNATPVVEEQPDSTSFPVATFPEFVSVVALPQSLQSASWLDYLRRIWEKTKQKLGDALSSAPAENRILRPGNTTLNFYRGQEWVTANNHKFVFQNDGNLVLYNPQGQPTWATGTDGTSANRLAVQADGNVVLYDRNGPVWATNTHGNSGAYLKIQSDGNVVVYAANGSPLFNTGTHSGIQGTRSAAAQWLRNRNLGLFHGVEFSTVINKATNKSLDAGGNNYSVYPHQSPNAANEFHQWGFKKVGNHYMIINKATGRILDGGGANGTLPYTHPNPDNQNPYQLWQLIPVGGVYLVVNKATGRALDAGGQNSTQIYMHPTPMQWNNFQLWNLNLPNTGYLGELSTLTSDQWDFQSGDDNQFRPDSPFGGDDQQRDTSNQVRQVYTDLSNAIFGRRVHMNTGYAYDDGYHRFYGKWHAGIDMGAPAGTAIKAVVGGRVAWVNSDFMGIDSDDGNHWVYGHLGAKNVTRGQRIEAGTTLAYLDSANHLHLEVQHGYGYARTNGAHPDRSFVIRETMSPLQAFWQLRNR